MKAPILALLVAGATAQDKIPRGVRNNKALEMAADRAKPQPPTKPGDLLGCTNDAVTAAKGKHVAATQALTGLQEGLKPLNEKFTAAIETKNTAIANVLLKDKDDSTNIQADYDAATKEIDSKEVFLTKTKEWEDAKVKYDNFMGRVTINSGIVDDDQTPDKQENKEPKDLKKGGKGKLALAKKALQDATDKQSALSTAFSDANDSYTHWGEELAREKLLLPGLATSDTALKNAKADVTTIDDKYATDLLDYNTKVALATIERNKLAKLTAEVNRIKGLISASTAETLSPSWGTELTEVKSTAATAKTKYADFWAKLKLLDAKRSTYTAYTANFACKTGQKNTTKQTLTTKTKAKCEEKCNAAPYLSFFDRLTRDSPAAPGDAIKKQNLQDAANTDMKDAAGAVIQVEITDYTTQWKKWYDNNGANSATGATSGIGDDVDGTPTQYCVGYTWKSTLSSEACYLYDKAAVEDDAAGTAAADTTCYSRDVFKGSVLADAKAAWKLAFDATAAYATKWSAYNTKINNGWAAYETNNKKEVKRLALMNEYYKMQQKAEAQEKALKDGDVKTKETDETNASATKEVSRKKQDSTATESLDYLQKKQKVILEQGKYDTAVAALKVVTDKIARIELIMVHMKNTLDSDKGTIKDIQAAKEKVDTSIDTANTGLKALEAAAQKEHDDLEKAVATAKTDMGEAEKTWKELKGKAEVAFNAVKTPLEEVKALRVKVTEADDDLKLKMKAFNEKNEEITKQKGVVAGLQKTLNEATEVCKAEKYDIFLQEVAKAKAARDTTISSIEKLIESRVVPAHGANKGRCEKPQSNGDRIRRGKCLVETDCCGAATGRPHGATGPLVTIEVCMDKESKTYPYVQPRDPMAIQDPTPLTWKFKCIAGASKLAGAAAAVLASAYMMA